MSNYLKIVERTKKNRSPTAAASNAPTHAATKETKATKGPHRPDVVEETSRDKRDQSDKRPPNFTPLTVSEALAEINRWGSGAGRNAELYRRGELSKGLAVEYVTCAILHRRGESFEVWKHHAPAVRRALALCIHELPPEECKVCNGYVKTLIEEGA